MEKAEGHRGRQGSPRVSRWFDSLIHFIEAAYWAGVIAVVAFCGLSFAESIALVAVAGPFYLVGSLFLRKKFDPR